MKPNEITLTKDKKFSVPDIFFEVINEFLSDKYGEVPSAYDYEIKITDIDWSK